MTLTDRLEAYLKQRPGKWIPASALATVAGIYAWRTRVSECRRQRGMWIENIWRERKSGRKKWRESFYRYVPE